MTNEQNSHLPAEAESVGPASADQSTEIEAGMGGASEASRALEEAQARAAEYMDQMLRTRAEMDNVQRRAQRDIEQARKYALERFVGELLPVVDSLEMGLNAASDNAEAVVKLREGTELTLKMLCDALAKFGVTVIDPQGQPFDPQFHQAMAMQPSANQSANTVLMVYQKGYALNDRLVRPARVVVAKAPDQPQAEEKGSGGHIDEHA